MSRATPESVRTVASSLGNIQPSEDGLQFPVKLPPVNRAEDHPARGNPGLDSRPQGMNRTDEARRIGVQSAEAGVFHDDAASQILHGGHFGYQEIMTIR